MPTPKKQKPQKRIINYIPPSEKHRAFHFAWKVPVRILCGGYGSGKSHSAAFEIIDQLTANPMFKGQKALVVGLTASHNRDQLLPEFKKILTCEVKGVNKGYVEGRDYQIVYSPTLKIILPHGSEIIFKSLEAGTNLAGFNVAIAFADEIDKVSLETWNEVQNRVRSVEGGFVIGTCNPANKSHWLYERYFKHFDEQGVAEPGVWLEYLTCYDNKFLPPDVIERYERQYGYSNLERERALMGRFVSMEGCVYSTFDRDRHTVDRDQVHIGTDWEVMAGLDFGFKDPTACVWVARTPEDKYVVFREHYEAGKTITYHADVLRQRQSHIPAPQKFISDHYSETVEMYRELGLPLQLADKGKGSIYQGIQLINQLLADDRLTITRSCKNLIREFETYQWKKDSKTSGRDEPLDKNNHALDALRMVITEMEGKPSLMVLAPNQRLDPAKVAQEEKRIREELKKEVEAQRVCIGYDINGQPEFLPLP